MPDQSSSSTEAVIRSYLASFATADPDAIAAHVSDDFANRHTSALGSSCDGRDAYRERLPDFLASMPGLEYGLDELVIDGDRAAAFYTLTGTWGGVPFSVQGAQRLVVRDGQITSRLDHWDSAVFLRQVDEAAATALRSVGLA
jgi:predicted ester cyclase